MRMKKAEIQDKDKCIHLYANGEQCSYKVNDLYADGPLCKYHARMVRYKLGRYKSEK